MSRFTQHFVDVLDMTKTPLEFFGTLYPNDTPEDLRKYLGRFGVSGKMQVQTMGELSDGQLARVVLSKMGRENPHILLLDEPTNHLDMESIDSLAEAIKDFKGGTVLVSHDMRLISQVAEEIWICDHKTVTKFPGDILAFKKHLQVELGLAKSQGLKGDASVKAKTETEKKKAKEEKMVEKGGNKADLEWGAKKEKGLPTPPSSSPTAGLGNLQSLGQALPSGGEAAAPVCAPAVPAADGECPMMGKAEWRKCDVCGKRHP
jgi:ABC-type multidrug transport system ATPase subunit